MRGIIAAALIWSGGAVILVGLACGVALSLSPLRRLRTLQEACAEIADGDLTRRLPTSEHHDELDMFAATVNYTMGEVERLMGEVKGATDTIAHDLRTPLTRARAQLHRLQQAPSVSPSRSPASPPRLDTVLERFRALMRISELEARERHAGFSPDRPGRLLGEVVDLYQPLAEAGGVGFELQGGPGTTVEADSKLLFEAVSNLVDNAIKFAGDGGTSRCGSRADPPQIIVEDNGPGIAEAEKTAVLQRFYRGERDRLVPGSGLGLSIVAAIVQAARFELALRRRQPGLRGGDRLPAAIRILKS